MRTTRTLFVTLVVTLAALALGATQASAAGNWKKYGGDCDDAAFKSPDTADIKVIARCVRLWEAYQDVSEVQDGAYKGRVISAIERLYVQGTDKDASVARGALARLGVTKLPQRGAATAKAETKKEPKRPARVRFNPEEPSKKQIRAADRQFKYGFKQYRGKKYDKALKYYLKMVDLAPGYAKGHYNVACAYALLGDEDKMSEYLQNLSDMAANGNADAASNLKLARTDTDFEAIRDTSVTFKRLTGYARVKVLNALGEYGEENTDNLMLSLKKLNYEADGVDESSKTRKTPIIWYAEHSKAAAYIIKELLAHPKTKTVLFTIEQLKGFDVVVVWGDDIKKDEDPKVYVKDPADAEKKLDELARKEDQILREPEAAVDEIEDALGKPEEIQDRIEDNLERPGKAVDRVEKTVDKVKGLFD